MLISSGLLYGIVSLSRTNQSKPSIQSETRMTRLTESLKHTAEIKSFHWARENMWELINGTLNLSFKCCHVSHKVKYCQKANVDPTPQLNETERNLTILMKINKAVSCRWPGSRWTDGLALTRTAEVSTESQQRNYNGGYSVWCASWTSRVRNAGKMETTPGDKQVTGGGAGVRVRAWQAPNPNSVPRGKKNTKRQGLTSLVKGTDRSRSR